MENRVMHLSKLYSGNDGNGFIGYWEDEDGNIQSSEFVYIGADKKFYYQTDFSKFVEIEKIMEVDDHGKLSFVDPDVVWEYAKDSDPEFLILEEGTCVYKGKKYNYIIEAQEDEKTIVFIQEEDNWVPAPADFSPKVNVKWFMNHPEERWIEEAK